MFPPVNRSESKTIFNVNIDRLLRYVTSTRILAPIPDALWDMRKSSISVKKPISFVFYQKMRNWYLRNCKKKKKKKKIFTRFNTRHEKTKCSPRGPFLMYLRGYQIISSKWGVNNWGQAWLTNATLYLAPFDNARWTIKSRKKTGTSDWQRTFAGGHENRVPSVTLLLGACISDDARSCVNDDCFDLPAISNRKFESGKKSDFGDFASSLAKRAALYEKLITW